MNSLFFSSFLPHQKLAMIKLIAWHTKVDTRKEDMAYTRMAVKTALIRTSRPLWIEDALSNP